MIALETKKLQFSIEGSFITRIAKEWFFIEHKPYETVEELLLSCMQGSDESLGKLKIHVQNILMGNAEFRGNSGDGTFELVYLTDDLNNDNIFTQYSKVTQENKKIKEESAKTNRIYSDLIDCLLDWRENGELDTSSIKDNYVSDILESIECMYNYAKSPSMKNTEFNTSEPILDSYLKATKVKPEYGWLDPSGKFYKVEWGDHQCWPYSCIMLRDPERYMSSHDSELIDLSRYKEEFEAYYKDKDYLTGFECGADFLTEKGWVLIHSPGLGIPSITKNEIKRLTKAQKEFLFDYFTNINEPKKASELYAEEDNY